MAMVACPSISETILGLTFLARSSVAHVWRRSWKRIREPGLLEERREVSLPEVCGVYERSLWVAKMRPWSR